MTTTLSTNPNLPPHLPHRDGPDPRLLLATGALEGPSVPQERPDRIPWLLLGIVALLAFYAVGMRTAELQAYPARAAMQVEIDDLRAQVQSLKNRQAEIAGEVEQKIDAYAMIEANRIVEAQEGQP